MNVEFQISNTKMKEKTEDYFIQSVSRMLWKNSGLKTSHKNKENIPTNIRWEINAFDELHSNVNTLTIKTVLETDITHAQ